MTKNETITVLMPNGQQIDYPAEALSDRASDLWADMYRRDVHTTSRFVDFAVRLGNAEKAFKYAHLAAQAGRSLLAIERVQRMRARRATQ